MLDKCVIHDTIHSDGMCPGLAEKPVGFGARESLKSGRWYLTRDGIGISHYKLTGTREQVQRWADVLNGSESAEAARVAEAERLKVVVVSISDLPEKMTRGEAVEFAEKLWGPVAVVSEETNGTCKVGFNTAEGLTWMGEGLGFKAAFIDAEQYL